ncbi:MAG: DHA2 family efflux MFS transporter permease subunit, partial [Parvularculaceae bacterium]|nr:DHA2 family efflux MFS transporter permease subunit [Parvularculaceae bacterium]
GRSSPAFRPMSASTRAASGAYLSARHPGILAAAVMGVSICQFLDLTIANVAIPHMRTSLGASMEQISWVLTSYIVASMAMTPLVGWLSDRFGSRRVFVVATAAFLFFSMLCGAAQSIEQMVLFRFGQGLAAALIGPMSQTIMFDVTPPEGQARAMSAWGIVVMIAPIAGPFLGGFLTEALDWRWVFYVNLPIGIPSLLILWRLLPSRPIKRRPLDHFGLIALGIGLISMQLALDRGESLDWTQSPEIVVELLVAASALWIFAVHFSRTPTPLFDRALVLNANFRGAALFMFVLGIANVALASLLPTMFQTVYGYGVLDTGALMAPRAIGIVMTMLVVNRVMNHVDHRALITTGFLIAAFALWTMTRWSLDMDKTPIILSGLLQGFGLGFLFVPMNIIAFATIDERHRPDGSSLLQLFRNLGSSVGLSVAVTMLARNTKTAHADLAATATPAHLPPIDPALAARLDADTSALLATLEAEISRQALMIAYLDNFVLMFWIVLAVAPAPFLLRGSRPMTAGRPAMAE